MKKYQVVIPKKTKKPFNLFLEINQTTKVLILKPETKFFDFTIENNIEYIYSRKNYNNPTFNVYIILNNKKIQLVPQEILLS